MSLAENVSERLSYKFYASGAITSNTLATSSSALGASGAQVLRFVSHNLSRQKDTYESNELREDQQVGDYRHGVGRIVGSVQGLLSPLTYGDWFQAAFRRTWTAAVTASQSDFTSVSADNSTSKFTFSGGNPVTKGLRVGMIFRFTNLSDADNNNKNFVITGIGGSNNRELTVYPAPDTMTADSSFTLTSFKTLTNPTQYSEIVKRKLGIESYQFDLDVAELYTEARLGGFRLGLPATGLTTVEFPVMGRDREIYEATNAPFFTSPTAQTSTRLFAAVNGLLRLGGTNIGVVTGVNINVDTNPQGPAVVGQNYVPEIFNNTFRATGDLTAFFENPDLIEAFDDETELELLTYLTGSSDNNAQAMTIYLPRIKLGGATKSNDASGGKIVSYPFQALKYLTTATGIPVTTMQICDTEQT